MSDAGAPKRLERLRALPDALGRPLHGRRRRRSGSSCPERPTPSARLEFGEGSQINVAIAVLIWLMVYPMMLKIDFTSILRRAEEAEGPPRDALRELARQAVLDGLPRVALLQARLLGPHLAGARRPVHRRRHHPGGRPLHGDGLRLVVPHRRRPGLHARPGLRERPDHARPLRADRHVPRERREQPDGAVQGPPLQRRHVHRHPARPREPQPDAPPPREGNRVVRDALPGRSSTRSRSWRSSRRSSSSSPSRPTTSSATGSTSS